jgi:Bax protein
MVPAVEDAYKKLYQQYESIKQNIQEKKNLDQINALKKEYKVKTDQELLIALKPHPVSITLAQAAIESAWGTSRFFREANNIFGVHGLSSKGSVPASIKKNGRTVWVRKYKTLEDAILDYYRMLSRVKTYKKFKKLNYEGKSVYEIVTGLKYYSERGDEYVHSIQSVIRHNNLIKYDTKVAN